MIPDKSVGVYRDGQWVTDVTFKHRWQARLFHLLLNTSAHHNGTRHY